MFHCYLLSAIGVFQAKNLVLSAVIGAPVLAGILKIMELGGRFFYVYVWCFMFAFSVIMITVAPVLIMPLFNKYTPLEVKLGKCDPYGYLAYLPWCVTISSLSTDIIAACEAAEEATVATQRRQ